MDCAAETEVGVLEAVADWAMNDDVGVGVSDVGITELEGGVGTIESLDDWLGWLWVDELGAEEDTASVLVEGLEDCVVGC